MKNQVREKRQNIHLHFHHNTATHNLIIVDIQQHTVLTHFLCFLFCIKMWFGQIMLDDQKMLAIAAAGYIHKELYVCVCVYLRFKTFSLNYICNDHFEIISIFFVCVCVLVHILLYKNCVIRSQITNHSYVSSFCKKFPFVRYAFMLHHRTIERKYMLMNICCNGM